MARFRFCAVLLPPRCRGPLPRRARAELALTLYRHAELMAQYAATVERATSGDALLGVAWQRYLSDLDVRKQGASGCASCDFGPTSKPPVGPKSLGGV